MSPNSNRVSLRTCRRPPPSARKTAKTVRSPAGNASPFVVTKSRERLEKARLDAKLSKETKEYNLGTSLKSYIDPMAYVEWANAVEFPLDKFYPKALKNKYSWALAKCRFSSEIRKEK